MVNYLSSVKKRTKPPPMAGNDTFLFPRHLSTSLKNRPPNITQSQQFAPFQPTASAPHSIGQNTSVPVKV